MGHLRGSFEYGLWSPRHGDQGAPISARGRRRVRLDPQCAQEWSILHHGGCAREAPFFVESSSPRRESSLHLGPPPNLVRLPMVARSLMPRSACSRPRGEKLRALRSRNSGSESPKLRSMSYEGAQTLRSVFLAPLRDAMLPLQRSQLLRALVRHGLKFWTLRPRVPTAKCSQFLPPWPGTCRTRHQRSFDHRAGGPS